MVVLSRMQIANISYECSATAVGAEECRFAAWQRHIEAQHMYINVYGTDIHTYVHVYIIYRFRLYVDLSIFTSTYYISM